MALNPFAIFKCELPHYHAELMPMARANTAAPIGDTPAKPVRGVPAAKATTPHRGRNNAWASALNFDLAQRQPGAVHKCAAMSRKDQFGSFDYLEWLSIGVVVACIAIVGYMVMKLITEGG